MDLINRKRSLDKITILKRGKNAKSLVNATGNIFQECLRIGWFLVLQALNLLQEL